ncbi:MAG: glycosyltransferase family 4 protein [Planctomycetes bacterium]|nr:glycosyltransferase family 4 protein [Planctomycetota bacterium]
MAAAHLLFAPSRAHVEGLSELALGSLGAVEITPPPLLAVPAPLRHKPIKGGHRLVTWGSIYPDKGLETVLDAMRAAGGDWSLQILGRIHDPDYERELRNFAAGLPVTFSGAFHTDDLAAIEADYAVLPSLCCESYGLVLDEAQALGLPVIASDVPAYREHAQPGSCLFFPPGDAASLAVELVRGDEIAALVPRIDRRWRPPPRWPTPCCATTRRSTPARHRSAPDRALERDRAEMLFRRAERRLWSALNTSDLRLPPDDFLRG